MQRYIHVNQRNRGSQVIVLRVVYLSYRVACSELLPDPPEAFVKYLPPFDLIKRMVEVSTVRGELRVSLAYDDFVKILRMMISGIEVDEGWYLKENGDIAQAIAKGALGSAKQHFVDDGYFEGRRPFPMPVDERFYLEHHVRCRGERAQGSRQRRGAALRRGWLPRGALALRALDACGNPQICHREQIGSPVAPCRSPGLGETPRPDQTDWGSSVMIRDTLLAFQPRHCAVGVTTGVLP